MANETLITPTGITSEEFSKMIQGAGGAYKRLDLKGGESAAEASAAMEKAMEEGQSLGVTRGGFNFDYTYEIADIDADGKLVAFKGSTQMTKMNAQVDTTLLTWDPATLAVVFGNREWDQALMKMKFRMQFTNDSYLDEMWFMFALIGGGYCGHRLLNLLNTNGSSPASTNDGQMELPITLVAHQAGLNDNQYAPAEMFWFLPEGKTIDPATLKIVDIGSEGNSVSGQTSPLKTSATTTTTKTNK